MAGAGEGLKLNHLAFLGTPPGSTIDVDLPRDRGLVPGSTPTGKAGVLFTARLFRQDAESPEKAFTRIKLSSSSVTIGADGFAADAEETEVVGGAEAPKPPEPATIDLLPASATAAALDAKWAEVEARLRAGLKPGQPSLGAIRTPPPTGGATPYRDVYALIALLRKVGAGAITFEGAAAPLPRSQGGGWEFR